jgi:hydrogenase maturation factor HypE
MMLGSVLREIAGLFVDDGALALAIIAIVAIAAIAAALDVPLVAGAILLFGCLGVLFTNAVRAARR